LLTDVPECFQSSILVDFFGKFLDYCARIFPDYFVVTIYHERNDNFNRLRKKKYAPVVEDSERLLLESKY